MRPVLMLGLVGLAAGCSEYTWKSVGTEVFAPAGSPDDPSRGGLTDTSAAGRPIATFVAPEGEADDDATADDPPETTTMEGTEEPSETTTTEPEQITPDVSDEPPVGTDPDADGHPDGHGLDDPGVDGPADEDPIGDESGGGGGPGDDGAGDDDVPGDDDAPGDDDVPGDDGVGDDDGPGDDGLPGDDGTVPGRIQGHIDLQGDVGVNAHVYCIADWADNKLRIQVEGEEFVLYALDWVTCTDDPTRDPEPVVTNFDTITGEGTGVIGGQAAEVWFLIADGGEPSTHDVLEFEIRVDGEVWAASGSGTHGNLQALPPSQP